MTKPIHISDCLSDRSDDTYRNTTLETLRPTEFESCNISHASDSFQLYPEESDDFSHSCTNLYSASKRSSQSHGNDVQSLVTVDSPILLDFPSKDRLHQIDEWVTPSLFNFITTTSPPKEIRIGDGSFLNRDTFDPFQTYQIQSLSLSNNESQFVDRILVLRQNFLFEIDSSKASSDPLGFASLHGAKIVRAKSCVIHIRYSSSSKVLEKRYRDLFLRSPTRYVADILEELLVMISKLNPLDLFLPEDASHESALMAKIESEGHYSVVIRGSRKKYHNQNCHLRALKIINKKALRKSVMDCKESTDILFRESAIQAHLTVASQNEFADQDHTPFTRLYGVFETSDIFILEMDLLDRCNLLHDLKKFLKYDENSAISVIRQLLKAMQFCHRNEVVHRDLKLSNIGFSRSCNPLYRYEHISVMDFGMASFIGSTGQLSGKCGTLGYVAPEVLKTQNDQSYSSNIDAYSIGVIAHCLLCGYEPFFSDSDEEVLSLNKCGYFDFDPDDWCDISFEAQDFIESLMDPDPTTRMSIEDALLHPWISEAPCLCRKQSSLSDATCTTVEDE